MASDRAPELFVVAAVIVAAWYVGDEAGPPMATAVAVVGLAAALWRPVLGIPVATVMAALAVYAPAVAIALAIILVLLGIIWLFVTVALGRGPAATSTVTPGDGYSYVGGGIDGGGFDGGGYNGGGYDGGI
jgi:hypothetical protein